jgi:hypothetical protein
MVICILDVKTVSFGINIKKYIAITRFVSFDLIDTLDHGGPTEAHGVEFLDYIVLLPTDVLIIQIENQYLVDEFRINMSHLPIHKLHGIETNRFERIQKQCCDNVQVSELDVDVLIVLHRQ